MKKLFASLILTAFVSSGMPVSSALASELAISDAFVSYSVATPDTQIKKPSPTKPVEPKDKYNKPQNIKPAQERPHNQQKPGPNGSYQKPKPQPQYRPAQPPPPQYRPGPKPQPQYRPAQPPPPQYRPGPHRPGGYYPGPKPYPHRPGGYYPGPRPGDHRPAVRTPIKKHGPHWCYGACSLHDFHNRPRTEKHWCDGYLR